MGENHIRRDRLFYNFSKFGSTVVYRFFFLPKINVGEDAGVLSKFSLSWNIHNTLTYRYIIATQTNQLAKGTIGIIVFGDTKAKRQRG